MAAKFKSSITDTDAENLLKKRERSTKWCTKIPGLYLIRLKKACSWRFRYTDDAGKRRTATIGRFPGMKPAKAAARVGELIAERKDPLKDKAERREAAKAEEIQSKARTLGRFLDGKYGKYQARRKSGPATVQRLKSEFPEWLDRDMASLTETDLEAWQERRETEGAAHSTIKRGFTALKTALNEAVRKKIIARNPLQGLKLQKERNDERTKKAQEARKAGRRLLTDDEQRRLFAGLDALADEIRAGRRNSRAHGKPDLPDLDAVEYPHWFVPFAITAFYTGMRPGDLYSMTWAECSPDFGRIHKIAEKTRHHEEPAEIVMDMAEPLQAALKRWHQQQGKPKSGLVFPSPVSGREMDRNAHRRPWKRVKALAGLPDDLDLYALRHHFISTLVAAGIPILTVAKLVGQKSASMIESHYGHLSPESAAQAISALTRSVAPKAANHG